ncbi:MAG: hypothetical protein ACODAC_08230 [Pseudomonadota bacterium]
MRKFCHTLTVTAFALGMPAAAFAAEAPGADATPQQEAEQERRASNERFRQRRESMVSANDLLAADVTNGLNPVGNVRDLVLNQEGTRVEHVLYEVPYPYSLYGTENGFVSFDNVAVQPTVGFGMNVSFDDESDRQDPETLRLGEDEAERRLVSEILGGDVTFAGDESRQIEDVLFDRETGEIVGYVVNENPDSFFNDEPRLVSAGEVEITDDGEVDAETEFAALEPVE